MLRKHLPDVCRASVLLGLFSFTLRGRPRSGPRMVEPLCAGVDRGAHSARDRNFLVFFVASILICYSAYVLLQHANQFLTEIGVANATGKQTLGQASEVLFILRCRSSSTGWA